MRKPLLAAALAATVGAIAAISAAPAPAAYPGANGNLLFTSTQDGPRHIFIKTATGIKDLTGVHSAAEERQPEFSPNGKRIVFTRATSGLPNTEIFTMSALGGTRTELTRTATGNRDATWSPDGKRIAFVSDRANVAGEIYVMNANGTHVHRITHNTASESDLVWSPTGGRIAFTREPGGGGDRDIYTIKTDGTGLTNLTHDTSSDEFQPDYSPGGYQIVYAGPFHPSGSVGGDLWIMNANGTNPQPLQHEDNGYSDGAYPAWSPNGKTIAFVANNGTGHPGVWKVPVTGGQNIEVVDNNSGGNSQDQEVDWQPRP